MDGVLREEFWGIEEKVDNRPSTNPTRYGPKDAHLQKEMTRLNVHIVPRGSSHVLNVQSTLEDRIRKAQGSDKDLMKIRKHTGENKAPDFWVDDKGTLWYKDRICGPKEGGFRQVIMDEAHNSA